MVNIERKRRRATRRNQTLFVWLGLSPIFIYFLVFSVYPVIYAAVISLHNWGLMDREHAFVGFLNYVWAFTDSTFYVAIKNTLYYAVMNVVGCTVLGILTAVFINSLPKRLIVWMRGVLFTPVVTSMVAVSLMFVWLYQPAFGVINYWLSFIGLGPYKFLQSTTQVIPSIVVMNIWKSVGYFMVIFIAGLTTIPRDLYEAADVDGADKMWQFFHVTVPLLKPTTLFVLVTGMISSFQVFTQIYNMSKGGPGTASRTLVMHIYEIAFRFFEMGRATAVAFVLFAIIMLITAVQMRLFRSDVEY